MNKQMREEPWIQSIKSDNRCINLLKIHVCKKEIFLSF